MRILNFAKHATIGKINDVVVRLPYNRTIEELLHQANQSFSTSILLNASKIVDVLDHVFCLIVQVSMLKKFLNAIGFGKSPDVMNHSDTEFVKAARANLIEQNKAHAQTWQLGKEQGWSADIGMGVIVFRFANGLTGTTHFQVVGSYDENDGSFLWGWAHSSVPSAFREHANLAKQWGSDNDHPAFLMKRVKCSLDQAMDFAAVANSLAGSKGVYRGHAGKKYIFLTLGDLHVESTLAAPQWAATANA